MIVTMTLNASLRVQYEAQRVDWGAQNRVTRVRYRAGGRGLAIARVLRTLGHDVVAAGLAGGATGELIATDLARSGVTTGFTAISGESRRILEVADADRGHTTILNEPPPYITTEELGRFAADYRRLMTGAAAVVLSGSLPVGLPPEIYGSLATYAAEAEHLQGEYVSVYVPTTPNPTSGFFLMFPRHEVIELDMSVDTALKYIISMGVVPPEDRRVLRGSTTADAAVNV